MAAVDACSSVVQPAIDPLSFPVELAIDAIASAVQPSGQSFPAAGGGTIRLSIQSIVDSIALPVEVLFNSVAALIEAFLYTVARIGEHAT